MRDRLPDLLDPASLTPAGREYRGALTTAGMQRLTALVHDSNVPDLDVRLFAGRDAGGRRFITGHVDGFLHLCCQRCLAVMDFPLALDFRLALVESEAEADRLGGEYEPLLIGAERISVRELVEDELLLTLPDFPQHAGAQCAMPDYREEEDAGAQAEDRPNPFAVLGDLKRK